MMEEFINICFVTQDVAVKILMEQDFHPERLKEFLREVYVYYTASYLNCFSHSPTIEVSTDYKEHFQCVCVSGLFFMFIKQVLFEYWMLKGVLVLYLSEESQI
jgi:hypothetical protein